MTVITAVFDARPGREAELESALRELVQHVAQEAGAIEYTLHRDPKTPGRFYFYERYANAAAIEAHMATSYLARLVERVPELCAAAPEIAFLEPLVSINDLRS